MTADTVLAEIVRWLRLVVLLKTFGVNVPLRGLGHVELCYLAGVYFLTK